MKELVETILIAVVLLSSVIVVMTPHMAAAKEFGGSGDRGKGGSFSQRDGDTSSKNIRDGGFGKGNDFKGSDNFKFKNNDDNNKLVIRDNDNDDNNKLVIRDNDNDDNNDVRTVVVHDNDDNEETIVVNVNTSGTCFVTQSEIFDIPNITEQLLDQCRSVTIIQG